MYRANINVFSISLFHIDLFDDRYVYYQRNPPETVNFFDNYGVPAARYDPSPRRTNILCYCFYYNFPKISCVKSDQHVSLSVKKSDR